MNKYAIVIPIYKEKMSLSESLSFNQLLKVCNDSDIFFVCPEGLDISNYMVSDKIGKKEFDKKYFESIYGYSKLCMSYELYDAFSDYEYIFIYQLDCWIFVNNIEKWCNKGYDYIGGPIYSSQSFWPDMMNRSPIPQVGNGGLSLRKVETMKTLFDRNGEVYNSLPSELIEFINVGYPEDVFICNVLNKYYFINIPSWRKAIHFSWDYGCEYAYNINHNKIPMAAHRIYAQLNFWQNFIPELDNKELIDEIKANKDEENKNIANDLERTKKMSEQIISILKNDKAI